MFWSFSEYLNLIELRSQTWCLVEMAKSSGIHIPHSEAVLFYAVLEGSARLSWGVGETWLMGEGDIAIVVSGDTHALRSKDAGPLSRVKVFESGEYLDTPIHMAIGKGARECRVLCGRLKARWPSGKAPSGLPALLRTSVAEAFVDVPRFVEIANTAGGSAVLTRMAMLIFVKAFREDPTGDEVFRDYGMLEPITRALQFIETHPFTEWTVARLADKVGMGRSNFATRFAKNVGKTPMMVVTEERMKHAAAFLEQTDLKVAEIADRVGYRSESAFSHRFFSHFGITPGEMRTRKRASQG